MSATLILRDQKYEVKAGQTIRQALIEAGVPPESVLATREGELITEDTVLKDGEVIKLVAVISGG
jgi:sulfur carrier protein